MAPNSLSLLLYQSLCPSVLPGQHYKSARILLKLHALVYYLIPLRFLALLPQTGTPCSLKDLPCLTDRKQTNNEEYGNTLILSVDDEPVNHMVIEECLSSTGYKVLLQWRPDSLLKHVFLALPCVVPAPDKCITGCRNSASMWLAEACDHCQIEC